MRLSTTATRTSSARISCVALALLASGPFTAALPSQLSQPAAIMKGGFLGWGAPAPPPLPLLPSATTSEVAASMISGGDLLSRSGLLSPASPEGWRIVLAGSFALFFAFTSLPGRLDTKLGRPKKEDMRFFTPSGWAFAIWGPIFLLEMVMAATAALAPASLVGPAGNAWLVQMAPNYAAAALHQVVWTMCFREWAMKKLWIPATCLTLAAFGLFSAHGAIVRGLSVADSVSAWGYIAAAVPVGLHFGWMCCAAVLSWNNVLNSVGAKRHVQMTAAIASCYGAAALLGGVSVMRKDPLPALVGCWALYAVSTGHEVLRGAIDALAFDSLNLSAKVASGLSLLAAGAAFVLARMA